MSLLCGITAKRQFIFVFYRASVVRSYSVFWVGIQFELPQCRTPNGNTTSTLGTDQPPLSTTTQTYQFNSTLKQPGQPNCTDRDAAFCVCIMNQKKMCQDDYVKRICCASCSFSSTGPTGPKGSTGPIGSTGSTGKRKFHDSADQDNSNSRDRH